MADGSIVFETNIDNRKAQKDLERLERNIEKAKTELEKKESNRSSIEAQLDAAKESSNETLKSISRLKKELSSVENVLSGDANASPLAYLEALDKQEKITSELREQEALVIKQGREQERITKQYAKAVDKVNEQTDVIKKLRTEAGDLEKALSELPDGPSKMNKFMEQAQKNMDKFSVRLKAVIRSALVFTVVTQALSKLRNWAGDVIKASPEAAAAIAKLKGALLTLAQPLVDIIIPAFTVFVNILTAVVSKLAQVFAVLAGSTVDSSKSAAEALNKQTKALNGTGTAAKKAGKSLANFDAINKLSTGGDTTGSGANAGVIAPDFDFDSELTDQLKGIADAVLIIGAGFALWEISENLPGALGTISGKLGLVLMLAGGLVLAWGGLTDAWENGVDWLNMAEMIGGVAVAAAALYKLFGKVGAGIALIVGGAAMMVTAFRDITKNGATLQNTLLLIAGIVATGLGFFILTGSVIPLVIAGIVSIVVEMLRLTGNLEEFLGYFGGFLSGVVDLLMSFITLDLERAKKGVLAIIGNLINVGITLVESFVNNCINAINWLIKQLNKIHFEFPDWVPRIGGKSFGIHIDQISPIQLPRLATGAVIPPNREFLAVLGDQKNGTNIETPLPTMIQAFKQALSEMGYSGQNEAYLMLDDVQLGKVIYKLNKAEGNRVGVNLTEACT